MATLDNKSIRGSVTGAVRYVNNPDKNLPPDGLVRAAAYIRGEHAVENLFSVGHNGCSSNPDIAIQQFRACEQLYRQKKGGAREAGLADGKQPIIAEHIFISFPPHENVPYDTQCEIVDKLCASEILKDFYASSNRHWNTDNDHSHLLVCNTSKDGSKKLGMNNAKRNALRKELDRICALDYGLSVIDDPGLRWKDPEREAFIRQLVDEGKVEVYAPADYQKLLKPEREYDRWMLTQIRDGKVRVAEGVSKNRECTQAEAYERWIAEQPYFHRERDKKAAKKKSVILVHKDDAKAARVYYWDERYRSSKRKDYYYAVRLYDDDGYRKPFIVLMIELLYLVVTNEELYYREKYPQGLPPGKYEKFFASTNWALQNSYDAFRYQREQGIRTYAELNQRIEQVGTDLAEARKGLAYYKKTIEKGDDLYKAILTFNTMEHRKKQNGSLTDEEQQIFAEAYRIMSAYKCNNPSQLNDFWNRRQFAEKKVKDLDEQIQKLSKDYHDLKFIDSHSHELQLGIEQYVWSNADTHSLDDIIGRAGIPGASQNGRSKEIEKISKNF